MSVAVYILGIVTAVVALGLIVELLRRRKLRERHAIWWIVGGILALIFAVFPSTLDWAAGLFGVTVPINLVFFVSLAILVLVCIQYSAELTNLEAQTRLLAEKVALQDVRIQELEKRVAESSLSASRAESERLD